MLGAPLEAPEDAQGEAIDASERAAVLQKDAINVSDGVGAWSYHEEGRSRVMSDATTEGIEIMSKVAADSASCDGPYFIDSSNKRDVSSVLPGFGNNEKGESVLQPSHEVSDTEEGDEPIRRSRNQERGAKFVEASETTRQQNAEAEEAAVEDFESEVVCPPSTVQDADQQAYTLSDVPEAYQQALRDVYLESAEAVRLERAESDIAVANSMSTERQLFEREHREKKEHDAAPQRVNYGSDCEEDRGGEDLFQKHRGLYFAYLIG